MSANLIMLAKKIAAFLIELGAGTIIAKIQLVICCIYIERNIGRGTKFLRSYRGQIGPDRNFIKGQQASLPMAHWYRARKIRLFSFR